MVRPVQTKTLQARTFAAVLALTAVAANASAAFAVPLHHHHIAHSHAHAYYHHDHHHPHVAHRSNQAASAGDRHPTHPIIVHKKAFGAPVWEAPPIQSPYPYNGKLAGDGILGTGFADSNVMRAWGLARY